MAKQGIVTVKSPYNGERIGDVSLASWTDCDAFLEMAHRCFQNRSNGLALHQRIACLTRLRELVVSQADAFALLIAREGGKPLKDSIVEVQRGIGGIELAIHLLHSVLAGEEIPMGMTESSVGRHATTFREPIGVVLAISAFNHPLNLIVHQVVPALAVGCPVIVKPDLRTPLSCQRFVEWVHRAGFSLESCQLCICENDVAQRMVSDPRLAYFSFIGSAKVGWYLKSLLAPGVRCSLEHGGIAPVIVDATADLDVVVPALLKGGFYHAGQVCVSVQRVYVHTSIFELLCERLASGASQLKVGDPTDCATDVGPLISRMEIERVHSWVTAAVSDGAKLLCGGKPWSDTVYAPTVLKEPNDMALVSSQEIFGPVVCVYAYDNVDTAISRANNTLFAFQAAVFSRDSVMIDRAVQGLDAACVMVNDHTAFRVDWMPFGGRKHSGYGVGGIGYTMRELTQSKLVVTRRV